MWSSLRATAVALSLLIFVPLTGAQDPAEIAWLGAFQMDVTLPYGIMDVYPTGLPLAVENERILGTVTEQLPAGFLPAHLRLRTSSGLPDPRPTTNFALKSWVAAMPPELRATLRFQRGANRFESPWVVILADPRASIRWTPAIADKAAVGCSPCERPPKVAGKTEADGVYEVWAHGRTVVVRPEAAIGGAYAYLGEQRRLEKRVSSVMADTVRIADEVLPSKTPPLFGTQSVNSVLVHSGELVRESVDIAIKGRGLDFVLRRFYSSAVYSFGPLGRNFDSPLFARTQWLPSGELHFYDGTGQVQRFRKDLTPYPGVFLRARNSQSGVTIAYPDNTIYYFDQYGRLTKITDRNTTKADGSDGNAMLFSYNAEGRLAAVVDPVGRSVRFSYFAPTAPATGGAYPGLLDIVTDFTGRTVRYRYDQYGRLTTVTGPDPASTRSAQQTTTYGWGPAPTSGNFRLDVLRSGQITSEKDGKARTLFTASYNGTAAWRVDSLATSLGTWSYSYATGATTVIDPLARSVVYGLDADGRVTSVTEPGGAATRYAFDAEGRLINIVRPLGTLTPLADASTYTYAVAADGDKRAMLNVTELKELPRPGSDEAAAGIVRATTVTYGERNQPTKITEPSGRTTTITLDARGNPSAVTDAAGLTTTLEYDSRGQLTKIDDPRTGTSTYTYFTADPVRTGYVQTATTGAGTTQFSVDGRGNVTKVTQPNSAATTYTVNALDQIEEESTATRKVVHTYDAAGMIASQAVLAGTAPDGSPLYHNTTFDIDEAARVRSRTDDGRSTAYGYDAVGNLTSATTPATAPITYGYDVRNRLTAITQAGLSTAITHDDDGSLRNYTNARGKTTTYIVGGFGEAVAVADPSGILDATTLDAGGRPVDQRTVKRVPNGETLLLRWDQFAYDALGRVTRQTRKRFTAPLVVPVTGDPSGATDIVTETVYDDVAHTMTVIDPLGNRVVTTFDALGRVAKVMDASGNTVETTYDENGNLFEEKTTERAPDGAVATVVLRYAYDRDNRVISVRNMAAADRETAYRYDERGNVVEVRDPMGRATTFTYDLRGNKLKETDPEGGVTEYRYNDADQLILLRDPKGNETTFGYDDRGHLTSERRVDGATWTHTHDENGNRKTTTDPNGTVVTNTYDDRDALVQRDIARGADVLGPTRITWIRDDLGRVVTTETDESVKTTASYDSLDRVLSETAQISSGPARTVTYAYDLAGNETLRTYPSGLAVSMTYTPLNALASVGQAGASPLVRYGYAGSRLATRSLSNSIATSWAYDPLRRLAEISHLRGQDIVSSVLYERTAAGEKIRAARPDLATRTAYDHNRNGWIVAEELTRTDTDINSLLRRTAYDIDAALNFRRVDRIVQTNTAITTSTSTTVNNRNQYTSFGSAALAYDRNGNLRAVAGTTLRYDTGNRLARATLPDGTVLEQTYDAEGRKVRSKHVSIAATSTTDYVLTSNQMIEEYTDGKLAVRYVRGRDIDEVVRAERSSGFDGQLDQILFPLQDELGNVERLTGPTGDTLERFEYEGYGEFRIFAGDAPQTSSAYGWRWLFQGREYLAQLGAYDFRARTLWPDLGRFGQEDPLGAVDSPNLYQAFQAKFNTNVDPLGTIINEVPILGTNRRKRYENWRNQLRDSSLGNHLWTLLDSSSVVITLTTVELTPTPDDDSQGAVTTRTYDAANRYIAAEIAFSDAFARGSPAPVTDYPHGVAIFAKHDASRQFNVYSIAHELGHALWPLRPWYQQQALQYHQFKTQIDALNAQLKPLVRGTPQYQQIFSQKAALMRQVEPLRLRSENYADDVGYQVYLSWQAAHPGWFQKPKPHLGSLP